MPSSPWGGSSAFTGSTPGGGGLFRGGLLLFRKGGARLPMGATLIQSAFTLWLAQGDAATIRQRLQEGQSLMDKGGIRQGHWNATSCWVLALLALGEGDTARAASLIQESLAIFREMDSGWFVA